MAKTKRSWIQLNFTHPDALRAEDIPYDSVWSVYDAINNLAMPGLTGSQGNTGVQGVTGPFYGPPGQTGLYGPTGVQGATGTKGATGVGATGAQGPRGLTGSAGPAGLTGAAGPIGLTGSQGITGVLGVQGLTGYQGITGNPGLGATGVQGATGMGHQGETGIQGTTGTQGNTGIPSQTFIYNPVSRYSVVDTVLKEVWVVSSSTAYTGLSWDRSGTDLTLYRSSHGHGVGNTVIVRDTNKDYQVATIDSTTANSFIFTTSNTGGTLGNTGAYSLGFTYSHTGDPSTGGTLVGPAGDHSDVQLLSMRIRTGTRVGTTYDLVVPQSATNGAGANSSLGNCYMPDFNVRTDNDILTGIGATMVTNISGSYSTFRFGALGSSDSRFILVHF